MILTIGDPGNPALLGCLLDICAGPMESYSQKVQPVVPFHWQPKGLETADFGIVDQAPNLMDKNSTPLFNIVCIMFP